MLFYIRTPEVFGRGKAWVAWYADLQMMHNCLAIYPSLEVHLCTATFESETIFVSVMVFSERAAAIGSDARLTTCRRNYNKSLSRREKGDENKGLLL